MPPEPTASDESDEVSPADHDQPDEPDAGQDHEELQTALAQVFDEWFVTSVAPGAAMAVQLGDGTVLEFVSGQADLVSGVLVEPDSVFRIASISKSMTAATVVDLAEDGLVDLDAAVEDYLGPGWVGDQPYASDITVRQLLDHSSGLVEYAFNPNFSVEAMARYGKAWTPGDLLDFVGRQGADFAPGSAFSYNTGGFIAAGRLIEEVTGESAAAVLRSRLFDPAGAASIGLPPEHPLSERHVSGYVDGGFRQVMIGADPANDEGLTLGNGTPVVNVLTPDQSSIRSAGWTGGGIEATMASTAAVWHAMFDGTVLGPEAVDELIAAPITPSYGHGVRIGQVDGLAVWSHTGGTAGFSSEAGYVQAADASFAMSANTSAQGNNVGLLADQVVALLAATG